MEKIIIDNGSYDRFKKSQQNTPQTSLEENSQKENKNAKQASNATAVTQQDLLTLSEEYLRRRQGERSTHAEDTLLVKP